MNDFLQLSSTFSEEPNRNGNTTPFSKMHSPDLPNLLNLNSSQKIKQHIIIILLICKNVLTLSNPPNAKTRTHCHTTPHNEPQTLSEQIYEYGLRILFLPCLLSAHVYLLFVNSWHSSDSNNPELWNGDDCVPLYAWCRLAAVVKMGIK